MATLNNAKNLTNQYGDATHFYGNGVNATRGQNNNIFYLERKGIKQATTVKVFSQFASKYSMPQHTGKEFRVTTYYNSYDRMPFTDDTWNEREGHKWTEAFAKHGFLADRDVADVTNMIFGPDGRNANNGPDTNGFRLMEGQLSGNKISLKTHTFTARLEQFGAMIDFTDQAIIFDDTYGQGHYHEQLGEFIGQMKEDNIQLDMLSSANIMYAGAATSMKTLGTGIGTGAVDNITGRNAVEESFKMNYELTQRIVSRLINFRAPKHKSILTGSTSVDTKTINPCYAAIVGNQVRADLENVTRGATVYETNFAMIQPSQYASQGTLMDGEVGAIGNIRFCASEQVMKFAGSGAEVNAGYTGNLSRTTMGDGKTYFDVFPVFIPCEDAYATIGLQGKDAIQWKSKLPGQNDTIDNYGVYGYFSASFWHAGIIKRPERMLVCYVLASA